MASQWQFSPIFNNPINGGNGGPTIPPDPQDPDAQCPYTQSTPAGCDPTSSGTLTLNFKLSPPTGCSLLPPVNIYLYSTDESFDINSGNLLTGFSGVIGSAYSYEVPVGSYAFYLSGQLGTSLTLNESIFQQGMTVTGYSVSNSGASNCISNGLLVIGWSGQYTYNIEEAPEYAGSSFTGFVASLPAGDYTLDMFNAAGCSVQSKISVGNSNPLGAITTVPTGVSCTGLGFDGSATVSGVGGTPPYSYAWYDSSGNFLSSASILYGVGIGDYTVQVQDSGGCSSLVDLYVGLNTQALSVSTQFTSAVTTIICCQESSTTFASLCALVQGGVPPYRYQWNNGATGICATGLSQGNFSVTITDSVGCVATSDTQTITIIDDCYLVRWDFGDGNIQQYMVPPGSFYSPVQNTYYETGNYVVRMSVVDGFGDSGIMCKTVTVPPCAPLSGLNLYVGSPCVPTTGATEDFSVTALDANGVAMPNVILHVAQYSVNLTAPPYNLGAIPTCDASGYNEQAIVGLPVMTNSYGMASFTQFVNPCMGIAVQALTSDNAPGIVSQAVQSNTIAFNTCGSPPPPPPPPPGGPPPPPPPPSPPPPPPPPGGGPTCACCIPQGDGSWSCQEMPRDACPGSVVTLNGLGTADCYSQCAQVPNMVTDCNGRRLCREAQGMCCTPQGCVPSTPCNCQKMDPPGQFFPITKDFSQANDDCNKACTSYCCDASKTCQTLTGPPGSTAQKCAQAGGTPAQQGCPGCQQPDFDNDGDPGDPNEWSEVSG